VIDAKDFGGTIDGAPANPSGWTLTLTPDSGYLYATYN
jgi:hypothetical protein